MIVVDTSVWVEYFRHTSSPAHVRLRKLLDSSPEEIAVTEIVMGEVLAGVPSGSVVAIRDRLRAFPVLRLRGLADFELAAALSRACRDAGESVRQLADCLVAVPTIRARATLLHADRDFEKLARHTPLEVLPV